MTTQISFKRNDWIFGLLWLHDLFIELQVDAVSRECKGFIRRVFTEPVIVQGQSVRLHDTVWYWYRHGHKAGRRGQHKAKGSREPNTDTTLLSASKRNCTVPQIMLHRSPLWTPRWCFGWAFFSVFSSESASLTKEFGCMNLRRQTFFLWHPDPSAHAYSIPFAPWYAEFPTNITWNGPSWGVCARKILKVFRMKTSFFLCAKKFCTKSTRRPCAPQGFWNQGECQHPAISLSSQLWCRSVSRIMNTSWTGFLSQHRDHVDGLLLIREVNRSCCCYLVSLHQLSCGYLQPHHLSYVCRVKLVGADVPSLPSRTQPLSTHADQMRCWKRWIVPQDNPSRQWVLNGFSRGAPRQWIHRWPQRCQNRHRGCPEATCSTGSAQSAKKMTSNRRTAKCGEKCAAIADGFPWRIICCSGPKDSHLLIACWTPARHGGQRKVLKLQSFRSVLNPIRGQCCFHLCTQMGKVQKVTNQRMLSILRRLSCYYPCLGCSLRALFELATPWEPLAHARVVLTPVDAKEDCRDCEKSTWVFMSRKRVLWQWYFFLVVLYLFQPPKISWLWSQKKEVFSVKDLMRCHGQTRMVLLSHHLFLLEALCGNSRRHHNDLLELQPEVHADQGWRSNMSCQRTAPKQIDDLHKRATAQVLLLAFACLEVLPNPVSKSLLSLLALAWKWSHQYW